MTCFRCHGLLYRTIGLDLLTAMACEQWCCINCGNRFDTTTVANAMTTPPTPSHHDPSQARLNRPVPVRLKPL